MLLKSLEIQGFKTFPDKTTLRFDNGITAVVGPNGSGKSNISDAMRWVLGEQSVRTLRCTKMEDVIFNGTPGRKAQGFAEVTLTIDNTQRQLPFENDTVAVTRRYYRSGESEYLINKAAVRLKDINELFMDTGLGRDGYSIIGQGKIDSIVAARSEDRREIFEEAAGVSRFRYRKEESQRRLKQAEENLLRLRDILAELEARVGPLKEQAEKARQYLAYAEEKRGLEIGLWLHILDDSAQILRQHESKLLTAQQQHADVEEELENLARKIEENFQLANACTAEADEVRQKSAQKEEAAASKDTEASIFENDRLHNRENIQRIEQEIEESARSAQEMEQDAQCKQEQIAEKEAFVACKAQENREKEEALRALELGMGEITSQLEEYNRQIHELTDQAAQQKMVSVTASSSMEEIERRLSAISENVKMKEEEQRSLTQKEQEKAQKAQELEEHLQNLQNTVKGYELRLNARRQKAEETHRQSDRLRLDTEEAHRKAALLENLERNLEGFSQSVKAVMREKNRGVLQGVHGPVSRLIKVPSAYAVAIETALGAAMQNIVVGTEQDAKHAIQLLKQRDSGRATFLPLSTIHGTLLHEPGLQNCEGFVGVAASLCSCEAQYTPILHSLLGRIAIAQDLDAAVKIARQFRYKFRIVTLDGQVVNTGGSLTGGSLARNSGLLSRASEIERIKAQAADLEKEMQGAVAAFKEAQEEASSAEAALAGARAELTAAQENTVRLESELAHVRAQLQSMAMDVHTLTQERVQATERLERLKEQHQTAEEEVRAISLEISVLQGKINEIHGSRGEQDEQSRALSAALQEIRFASLSAQKDIEALHAGLQDLALRKADRQTRIEALKSQIDTIQASNEEISAKAEQLRKEAQALRDEAANSSHAIERIMERRMQLEKNATDLRAKEREKSAEKENIGHELARLEERKGNLQKEYDEIIKRLWEEYELTRREAQEMYESVEDTAETRKRLNELKLKIKGLGSVNVSAVEEYKEVSERYEFMKQQIEDVEKSRDELQKLIFELTKQMQELFVERFEQINTYFQQTFRELFGGGTAGLSLSTPEDVLTSGIDISVQPPGKIVTHLEALSGGEKALVAIALYFAIMKVNPPPFCVLDEIEAALDDVNVDRFASYLRRMNDKTQYIAITHRRGTMEEADVLYGVTMQDEGISKVLALRAADVEAKLGMRA